MDLIEQCFELDWTDGLPVVPPTRDRVEAMLAGRDPDRVIAILEPALGEARLEAVAANAVMAGCRPEYFPVVLAAIEAVADPTFRLNGVLTTIHSQSPAILVNGPVIDQLGFNAGSNVLGSGTRANATVGRALLLAMRNIAGARAGALDPATLGHPGKFSFCLAENETISPWPSFAADRGFGPDESTVTVFAADGPFCLAHLGARDPESLLRTIADALPLAGTYNLARGGEVLVVMSPEHAAICAGAGWSKADVQQFLFEKGRRPAREVRGLGVSAWGDTLPRWMNGDPETLVGPVTKPERIAVIVAGGEIGGYTAVAFVPGQSVTRRIDLEDTR